MTIPEQAGKVATSAIDAFRNNPACLAAILLAGVMAALTFFALQADASRKTATMQLILEKCMPQARGAPSD